MATKGKAKDDKQDASYKAQQLRNRRLNRGNGEIADWASVDGGTLVRSIAACTKHGFAITLGYTRDGGAYTIRVLGGDGFETEYVRPSEDISLYLRNFTEDFESI